ncbi:hypothetical protein STRDD11_00372 [Streptococcus sp. DD11]|nr:hypothetical protein STRDD11_00372 [Streptococcus sp. DD11]
MLIDSMAGQEAVIRNRDDQLRQKQLLLLAFFLLPAGLQNLIETGQDSILAAFVIDKGADIDGRHLKVRQEAPLPPYLPVVSRRQQMDKNHILIRMKGRNLQKKLLQKGLAGIMLGYKTDNIAGQIGRNRSLLMLFIFFQHIL